VLQHLIDKKTGHAQRNFKKALRGFVDHCMAHGMIKIDPLAGIKLSKMKKTGGYPTWTMDEVAQYRQHYAPGTRARLALELLLQTGHARADVVRMGRWHVKNGWLSMRRQKTNVQFDIPLLPELVAEIALHPMTDQPVFLVTARGKPFTAASFGMYNRASYRWTIREWWSTSDSNRAQFPCKGDPRTLRVPRMGLLRGPAPCSACTERWREGSDPHELGGAWGRFRAHLSAASTRRFHQISFPGELRIGAADGNRTHVCTLATLGSAIELRLVHRAGLEPAEPEST
jgi:hypothetical protein